MRRRRSRTTVAVPEGFPPCPQPDIEPGFSEPRIWFMTLPVPVLSEHPDPPSSACFQLCLMPLLVLTLRVASYSYTQQTMV